MTAARAARVRFRQLVRRVEKVLDRVPVGGEGVLVCPMGCTHLVRRLDEDRFALGPLDLDAAERVAARWAGEDRAAEAIH